MKTILTFLYNLAVSANPVFRVVLGAGTVALALNTYLNSLWASLFVRIGTISTGAFGGTVNLDALGLVNYVFPLDTFCSLLTAYLSLLVVCTGVRIVKSFIPTIS